MSDLCSEQYVRERLAPRPGDPLYLHLADLRAALDQFLEAPTGTTLDFGAGGAPYRSLFGDGYCTADIAGSSADVIIGAESELPMPAHSFDTVLSTQVLEHLEDPHAYLTECRRVLRRGGRLLLTTHGTYVDHNCPGDFRRWTGDGLRLDLARAGFRTSRLWKLTTGPRAIAFLLRTHGRHLVSRQRLGPGLVMRVLYRTIASNPARFDRFCDRNFARNRIEDLGQTSGSDLYIAVAVEAVMR